MRGGVLFCMYQTILQSIFIATFGVMILGLILPAFYQSKLKTDTFLSKFVVPIDNASDASQAFTVSHMETLIQKNQVLPENIVLIAYGKGVYLLEIGNHFQTRLQALSDKGVQFYASATSQAANQKGVPDHVQLLDGVKTIADGKQYIENLMEQGFVNSFA